MEDKPKADKENGAGAKKVADQEQEGKVVTEMERMIDEERRKMAATPVVPLDLNDYPPMRLPSPQKQPKESPKKVAAESSQPTKKAAAESSKPKQAVAESSKPKKAVAESSKPKKGCEHAKKDAAGPSKPKPKKGEEQGAVGGLKSALSKPLVSSVDDIVENDDGRPEGHIMIRLLWSSKTPLPAEGQIFDTITVSPDTLLSEVREAYANMKMILADVSRRSKRQKTRPNFPSCFAVV